MGAPPSDGSGSIPSAARLASAWTQAEQERFRAGLARRPPVGSRPPVYL